jgi:hypothetical protein
MICDDLSQVMPGSCTPFAGGGQPRDVTRHAWRGTHQQDVE